MCGIFACIGRQKVYRVLLDGLRSLEYRGYDSAGMSFLGNKGDLISYKAEGKVMNLHAKVQGVRVASDVGISHTRWATHGEPTTVNAHPHLSVDGTVAVVHNGIIENYHELKKHVCSLGYVLTSQTDTELIVHLIHHHLEKGGSLLSALKSTLKQVTGAYGLAFLSSREGDRIIGARKGSPLVVGLTEDQGNFLASDTAAMIPHTRRVVYLEDGDLVILKAGGYELLSTSETSPPAQKREDYIDYEIGAVQKQGYEHFMLKEIFEQPQSVQNGFLGRMFPKTGDVKLGGLNMTLKEVAAIKRVLILACGTSWHAAMIGEYLLENLVSMPVEVDYASEFAHRNCVIEEGTLVLVISQSGETADSLMALREVKTKGVRVYGIVNAVGSSIARETDGGIYIHAGPEIGVASTKAFTSQVVVLVLLSIYLGRTRLLSRSKAIEILHGLERLPEVLHQALESHLQVQAMVQEHLTDKHHALYLGRSYNFPVALEGALKLKEIAYIHAEGYPAAEMKHGPIALIDENMPVIAMITQGVFYKKMLANIQEVRARKAHVIGIASMGDTLVAKACDQVIHLPKVIEEVSPIVNVIPLQLMAYYAAVQRGCDVDQPRNLAKSVTVE